MIANVGRDEERRSLTPFPKISSTVSTRTHAVLNIAPTDQGKVVPPAGEPEEHPPPSDPKAIFLGGLFVLALLTTAYVAREIVLPLVFAIVLKLLLQPACGRLSIHCNCFCDRWKILAERHLHQMGPSRSEVQLF